MGPKTSSDAFRLSRLPTHATRPFLRVRETAIGEIQDQRRAERRRNPKIRRTEAFEALWQLPSIQRRSAPANRRLIPNLRKVRSSGSSAQINAFSYAASSKPTS